MTSAVGLRQAFHSIEQVERQLGGNVRFAFRHLPMTSIHPHALGAASAAEAAARQGRFWTCTSCCSTARRRWKTAT
jgi:protein-disulfide isomerase